MFKQCFAQIKRKTKIQILKNELNFKTKISIISKYLITLVYKSFRCCRLWIDLGVPKNKKSQENKRKMDKNNMKGLIVMIIMLSGTILVVLKHVEGCPLPCFSDPHMPPSLHPLPLPTRLPSFSPGDRSTSHRMTKIPRSQRKELKRCYRKCHKEFAISLVHEFDPAWSRLRRCLAFCQRFYGNP